MIHFNSIEQFPTVTREEKLKESPADIASVYVQVVKKFINRHDVQNGTAIGYVLQGNKKPLVEDTPRMGIGQGFGTTGWCVSASAALLKDPIFENTLKLRNARAKLISIDIKEQWYGKCYNGTFNKWHTCILLLDSGYYFAVDITCAQFSSMFIGKYFWDFKTWESTFRSPYCRHNITDFDGKLLSTTPCSNFAKKGIGSTDFSYVYDSLHDVTSISDEERKFLTDYFLVNMSIMNDKLSNNYLSQLDFNYMENVNNILKHFNFKIIENGVSVLRFKNKKEMERWLSSFEKNGNMLNLNIFVSKNIKDAFNVIGDEKEYQENFNIKATENSVHYVVLNFAKIMGSEISFNNSIYVPYGTYLDIDEEVNKESETNTRFISVLNIA